MYVFSEWGEAGNFEVMSGITASTGFTLSKLNTASIEGLKGLRARAALVTVETASILFTMDGTPPTISGGIGHQLAAGDSMIITGQGNLTRFRCINLTGSNGAILKVTYYF